MNGARTGFIQSLTELGGRLGSFRVCVHGAGVGFVQSLSEWGEGWIHSKSEGAGAGFIRSVSEWRGGLGSFKI